MLRLALKSKNIYYCRGERVEPSLELKQELYRQAATKVVDFGKNGGEGLLEANHSQDVEIENSSPTIVQLRSAQACKVFTALSAHGWRLLQSLRSLQENEETTTEGFSKAAHPEVPEAKTSELKARSAGISPSMQDLYSRLSQRTDDSTKSRISVGRRRKRG